MSRNMTGSEPVVGINMIDIAMKYKILLPGNLYFATAYETHAVANNEAVGMVRLKDKELKSMEPKLNNLKTSA